MVCPDHITMSNPTNNFSVQKRARKQKNNSKNNNNNKNARRPNGGFAASVAAASRRVGRTTSTVLGLTRNIPVVGNLAQAADFAANTLIPFVAGLFSQVVSTQYDNSGKMFLVKHSHISEGVQLTAGLPSPAGTILIKMPVTIGLEGSRSRTIGSNFERVVYHQHSLVVEPNCSAVTSGSLLYVYVPDPLDNRIDVEPVETRLTVAMSYATQLKLQLFASGRFEMVRPGGIGQSQFYIRPDTGSERLTTPGNVYVIAASDVDTAFMPTLRLQTRMRFSQPSVQSTTTQTLRSLANAIAEVLLPPSGSYARMVELNMHTSDVVYNMDTASRNIRAWDAGHVITDTEGADALTVRDSVLVKKGERITIVLSDTNVDILAFPAKESRPTEAQVAETTAEFKFGGIGVEGGMFVYIYDAAYDTAFNLYTIGQTANTSYFADLTWSAAESTSGVPLAALRRTIVRTGDTLMYKPDKVVRRVRGHRPIQRDDVKTAPPTVMSIPATPATTVSATSFRR